MTSPRKDVTMTDSVGPYRLLRAIGAGGSARIDLARIDRAYGFVRHVVVKRPLEHLRSDPTVAASLRREARLGGQLRHPNLVAVLDAGTHDHYDYLVLEYVNGTSLRDLMQTETGGQVRALPLAVALAIVIDIARGLHEAHELTDEHGDPLGLVHRDVSPGNVLIGIDGAVKIADFGIAKETRVTTLSGSMHGTVTYMAPEQCRGHAIDRRADIWALGVILHELVTKQRLFWADNDVASLHRVLSGQISRPRKIDPNLSPALDEIVMTAVAQDPQGRFATTRELADALEAHAAHQGLAVGARGIARVVEAVVGARGAPWIDSTNVDPQATATEAPEPAAEASLVDVLERAIEVDAGLLPTFGPADEHAGEEGAEPMATPPAKKKSRRVVAVVVGAAIGIGVGLGSVLAWQEDSPSPRREPPDRSSAPTPGHVAPAPVPAAALPAAPVPAAPVPAAQVPAAQVPATPVPAAPVPTALTPPITPPASLGHRHPHVTNASASGSNANNPALTSAGSAGSAGSGSATPTTKPTNVQWTPNILLPSDTGSGTKKP